jgi:hypothetical protein
MPETDNTEPGGNADFAWAAFDSEAYFQQYYGDPHPDDDLVTTLAARAFRDAEPAGAALDVVDVGTGPSLIPFLSALPRARRLTAWEYSDANIRWLEAELRRDPLRPQWRHFWDVARAAHEGSGVLPDDPAPLLRERGVIRQGSIFDLPAREWDAATMFFCAESITRRHDEFESACAAFARSVRPGGTLAAAFLVSSDGYTVSDTRFPALRLSPEAIEGVFDRLAGAVRIARIGIVEREIRSGYTGAVFLTATAS